MRVEKDELVPCRTADDIVRVRKEVRARTVALGFTLVDQTKLVTAASEIARNTVEHGGGGIVRLQVVNDGVRNGLRLVFEDRGPGIRDIALAMSDRYSTGTGLGLGLSGAKRLSQDFSIDSKPGEGTTVVLGRWK
ncbi:MAG: anti-sigma regulatory factor [Rhodospirillales bacterium]|nr:anti-sigma regulatory factor [Rhodospirillales bacterium]